MDIYWKIMIALWVVTGLSTALLIKKTSDEIDRGEVLRPNDTVDEILTFTMFIGGVLAVIMTFVVIFTR
jgi:hypothetical protein